MNDRSGQRDLWRVLFREERPALTETADLLSHGEVSTEQILVEAYLALEETPFRKVFAQRTAIRQVVKVTLAHSLPAPRSRAETRPCVSLIDGNIEASKTRILPWLERVAYVLHKVLCYSRRDSALLIGISDANLVQLVSIAERRIASGKNNAAPSLTELSETVQEEVTDYSLAHLVQSEVA
jgi:hypothetical protein